MKNDNKERLSITLDPLVHSELLGVISGLSGKRKSLVLIELMRLGLEASAKGYTLGRIPHGNKPPVFQPSKPLINPAIKPSNSTNFADAESDNKEPGNPTPNPITYDDGSPPEYLVDGCTSIPVPRSNNQPLVSDPAASTATTGAEQDSDSVSKLSPKDKDAVNSFLDM